MSAVPFVRPPRARRAKPLPEEPLIPQRGRGSAGYWLYLIPGLILLSVVILIPLVWNIYLSFTSWRGIKPPEWIGVENWTRMPPAARLVEPEPIVLRSTTTTLVQPRRARL